VSIRSKLSLLFLSVGLVPALLVSLFAYISISNELTAKTEEQIESIAAKQEQRLNALIQSKQEETVRLAGAQFDLNKALASYLQSHQQRDFDTILKMLRDRKAELQQVQSIYLTDLEGNIIATTATSEAGKRLDAQDIYLNPTQPSTVRLREDKNDRIDKLYVTARVHVDKKQVATLLVVFKLNDIIATIEDYTGLGKTGETVVAQKNADGNIVSLFSMRFDTQAALKTKVNELHLLDSKQAVYSDGIDYRGHDVIVATGLVDSANWGLATKIDKKEALAPIVGLRNVIVIICAGASVIIVLIALYFARSFTKPILILTSKTRGMIEGDLKQRITVNSSDEIGTLATTFNQMAGQLAQSYEALEQKVAQRTHALDQKVGELEEAKAKDDAIIDSIGDGMIVTNSNGVILFINAVAVDLLGHTPATLNGGNIASLELWDESEQPMVAADRPAEMALVTGHKVTQIVKSLQGGAKRVLGITATPVMQRGRAIGTIQIIRDITKEKEVDRMKTEFISIASHQLRTPLSAIKWFSEMLMTGDAGKLETAQTDFVKNISDSTERMIELVNSLLNISRMESGRIIVDPKPTNLSELVNGIITDLKGKTEQKRQTLIVSVHKDLPLINLDPRLIGQVYLNLLTNAIKYTPEGGEISVIISRKDDMVISQVTDSGYGIPKEEQAKMFQKFFRATNIAKIETDGTGLGMYLVKSIIESSGGKIWFESEEGKGTTFWFSTPLAGMKAKAGEVSLG
jgi:PAS domain S-box-containing protein